MEFPNQKELFELYDRAIKTNPSMYVMCAIRNYLEGHFHPIYARIRYNRFVERVSRKPKQRYGSNNGQLNELARRDPNANIRPLFWNEIDGANKAIAAEININTEQGFDELYNQLVDDHNWIIKNQEGYSVNVEQEIERLTGILEELYSRLGMKPQSKMQGSSHATCLLKVLGPDSSY